MKHYKINHVLMTEEEYFKNKNKPLVNPKMSAKDYVNQTYIKKMRTINCLACVADQIICSSTADRFTKVQIAQSTLVALRQNLDEIQEGIKTLFGIAKQTDKDLSDIVRELQESFKTDALWAENMMNSLENLLEKLEIEEYGFNTKEENWGLAEGAIDKPLKVYRNELEK